MRRTVHEANRPEALDLAHHAAQLIDQQASALDTAVVSNKLSRWKPHHILDGTLRGARGYHEMRAEQDAFVHETQGTIYNTRKVVDETRREHDMARYAVVAPYHRIALQGAHRIVAGPDTGRVHYFQFQGDVVNGEAKYTALRPDASVGGFVLRGVDAWKHSIPHLQDIPGLLELEDPTRPGSRELPYLSPATVMGSIGEYLRRQSGQANPAGDQPPMSGMPGVNPSQGNLFPYMSPLPHDEQWSNWGDQRHGGLGGHNSGYGQ